MKTDCSKNMETGKRQKQLRKEREEHYFREGINGVRSKRREIKPNPSKKTESARNENCYLKEEPYF